jgi:hypothetical protein
VFWSLACHYLSKCLCRFFNSLGASIHSKKAKKRGYSGKKSLQQSFIQIEQKRGFIGIKSNSQKSIIQKKRKIRVYRDKRQFTEISHSNRAQNTGLSG